MLQRHEGLRLRPYRDSTGKLTIGVGRNLDSVGLSEAEAYHLLDNDIDAAVNALTAVLPVFAALDDVRQEVLIDMCFNEGILRFTSANPKMIRAFLARGDYD